MQIKIDQSYKRLDKFLFQYFESLPLSLLQRLIRKYKIKINNKKSKANSSLIKGDVVYIYYKFEISNDLSNTIKISKNKKKIFEDQIMFQNNDFIAINKIDGYSVQRGSKVLISLKDIYENVIEHKLYIVHRLDKDTSGLMLFAKNRITASKISSLFLNNKIKKYYIAVTNTEFNKNTDTLINYNSDKKELKLAYKKIQLDKYDNCYLIKLFTGKKHQIRLQFYLNKNPIIGDKKFSGNKFNKLLLCSYKIIFELDGKFYKFKINPNKIFSQIPL